MKIKNFSLVRICCLLIVFGAGITQHCLAQYMESKPLPYYVEPPMIGASVATDSSRTLTYTNMGETSKDLQNIISLIVKEDSLIVLPSGFTATVTFTLETRATLGGMVQTQSKSLTVTYDTTKGSTYKVRSYIILDAPAEEVKLTITNVSITGYSGWDPQSYLQLDNEMRVSRYFTFDPTKTADYISHTSANNELNLTWHWEDHTNNNVSQLEWAWVEDEMIDYYKVGGVLYDDNLFANNSTRVDLDYGQSAYTIPLLYDGIGKLYYRLRPAYRKNNGSVQSGSWTPRQEFSYTGHDSTLNWQSSSSYAEEGKRKTVIQYFDGASRSRQTVTKDNTTGNTVVGETVYDLQGRPNLQILPTPTIDNTIKYFKGFNRFIQAGVTQGPNDDPALYFDLTPAAVKCNRAAALDSNYGNSRYYSNNNDWLTTESTAPFIPNGYGYAFTETRFTEDATQRISKQGGVGITHQIGSGHETTYYYGKPLQPELDALFGTEVGDASHYSKNMVQDANGQMSVSYVDMHGRTVATALAGASPANLVSIKDNLDDYPQISGKVTDTLVKPVTNQVKGNTIESVSTILVPAATEYNFTYKLDPAILKKANCTGDQVCFDCKYDLEIAIMSEDACATDPVVLKRYNNLSIVGSAEACDSSMGFKGDGVSTATKQIDFAVTLPLGSYTIRKTLTINDSLFALRRDSALKVFLCKTQKDLEDSLYLTIEAKTGCGMSQQTKCDSCNARLGTYSSYRTKYLVAIGKPDTLTVYDNDIRMQYGEDSSNCANVCGKLDARLTTLYGLRQRMLADMKPYTGQYARPKDSVPVNTLEEKYNIFTREYNHIAKVDSPYYKHPKSSLITPGDYKGETGKTEPVMTTLSTMPDSVFAGSFQPSWANSLIYYHPEYAKLRFAEDTLRKCYDWLDSVLACESYSLAHSYGFDDPLNHDPYFVNNYSTGDEMDMTRYLTNYIGTDTHNPSIWQIANSSVLCSTVTGNVAKATCMMSTNETGIDTDVPPAYIDSVWNSFKGIYLGYRNDMVVEYINAQEAYSLSPTDRDTLQQTENKQLVFTTTKDFAHQNGIGTWYDNLMQDPPDTNVITNGLNTYMQENHFGPSVYSGNDKCELQRPMWRAKLLQCEQLTALLNTTLPADSITVNGIINTILDSMVMICHATYDAAHTSGATTRNPAIASGTGSPLNFETVVNNVFNQHGIHTQPANYYCNPFSIDNPGPYNGFTVPVATYYSNTIDSCGCKRFADLKEEARVSGVDTSSFIAMNNFLNTNYKDSLTWPLWNGLRKCKTSYKDTCYLVYSPITHSGLRPSAEPLASDCYDMSIDTLMYINTTSVNNVKVTYKTGTSDSCKLVITNVPYPGVLVDSQYLVNDTINIACDSGSYILSLPACDIYSFTILSYTQSCGLVDAWYYLAPEECTTCTQFPVINRITTLQPQPDSAFQNVVVDYSLPPGAINAHVIAEFAGGNRTYQVPPTDSVVVTPFTSTCSAPRRYFVAATYDIDGICKSVHSDWVTLDSCWKDSCITGDKFIPVLLNDFVAFPQFLNCDYKKPCITCTELDTYVNEFRQLYPQYAAAPYLDNNLADTMAAQNNLLARFINYRTGFSVTTGEYLQAYSTCKDSMPKPDYAICTYSKPLNEVSGYYVDKDPCKDARTQAAYEAQVQFQLRKQNLIAGFDSAYKALCLGARYKEQFYVKYTPKEYHYTLYYYDQAGNLVKTIPPAAVKPNYDSLYLDSVSKKRVTNTDYPNYRNNELLATRYAYNSLNQVVQQGTPDAGISNFWYDRLGRLAISRNAKQAVAVSGKSAYSYTVYDPLGRITEVGEKRQATAMTQSTSQNDAALNSWLTTVHDRTQITGTIYDEAYTPVATSIPGTNGTTTTGLYQQNLRNRVSYTYIKSKETAYTGDWNAATYYSYDIHGNVDTLLQDYDSTMGILTCTGSGDPSGNRYKKIVYYYDLISGKVNDVAYQPGQRDEYYHRYSYDAENRIIDVETSKDKIYWEREADYSYYRHGPLSRTILGQNLVQGIDHVYTLQGWLKGVNGANSVRDVGNDDGVTDTVASTNAYLFYLNYFTDDYHPISGNETFFPSVPMALPADPVSGIATGEQLFNGNIGSMMMRIPKLGGYKAYGYRYDQLNRLVGMDAFNYTAANAITHAPASTNRINDYHEEIKYDPNGNILSYKRNGTTTNLPPGVTGGLNMDNLAYNYIPNTNKLRQVTDDPSYSNNYPDDIDNQVNSDNYAYDAIGNLVQDKAEGITSIDWTVYGKINKIVKGNGTTISYTYDAAGNRITKTISRGDSSKSTYYVRDASGNIMSIYQGGYATINNKALTQTEINLYGSSRLGIAKTNVDVQKCFTDPDTITNFIRGNKFFELTNHLGNVLVTVSDKKQAIDQGLGHRPRVYFAPDVVTANDYYPFGMLMPGRNYYTDTTTENVGGAPAQADPSTATVYKHSFNSMPYNHPYVVAPDVMDSHLSTTGWTNNKGAWTSYSDCASPTAGQSLAFTDTRPDTATVTLTLNVESGKTASIKSFSFSHRNSATGYAHWKMYINGVEVGDSTMTPTSSSSCTHVSTGTRNVTHAVDNLTGTIKVVLKLYDHTSTPSAQGTFRMNDFILNGFTKNAVDSSAGSPEYVHKGYRYGFNGQEHSYELNDNDYTAMFWEYDSRIARRWNVDPKPSAEISPYNCFASNPILFNDTYGDTPKVKMGNEFYSLVRGKDDKLKYIDSKGTDYTGTLTTNALNIMTGFTNSLNTKPNSNVAGSTLRGRANELLESPFNLYITPDQFELTGVSNTGFDELYAYKLSDGKIAQADHTKPQPNNVVGVFISLTGQGTPFDSDNLGVWDRTPKGPGYALPPLLPTPLFQPAILTAIHETFGHGWQAMMKLLSPNRVIVLDSKGVAILGGPIAAEVDAVNIRNVYAIHNGMGNLVQRFLREDGTSPTGIQYNYLHALPWGFFLNNKGTNPNALLMPYHP